MRRLCAWCRRRELPLAARADAVYCTTRCQVAAWRARRKASSQLTQKGYQPDA